MGGSTLRMRLITYGMQEKTAILSQYKIEQVNDEHNDTVWYEICRNKKVNIFIKKMYKTLAYSKKKS